MSGYSGGGGYSVHSSSSTVNGMNIQKMWIEGNGISEHLEYQTPSARSKSLSVFNTDGKLIIAAPENDKFLVYSDTPGTLVIMRDGVCTEKTYHVSRGGVTSSTSRQISASQCEAISRRAAEELEKNRNYWNKWSKDFNRNMQDTFPPGFPFHNQQQSQRQSHSGSSAYSDNVFQGLANMHKNIFSRFPFNY